VRRSPGSGGHASRLSIAQLEANVAATDGSLTDDEHSALTDAAERFRT
jgi:hypothetical protein